MPTHDTRPKPVPRHVTLPQGFTAGATTCGLKPSGQPDLAVLVADQPATAAGVLTRSRTPGAAVAVCREHLRRGRVRAIVCNSGVANVATGARGQRDAVAMCDAVAARLGCHRTEVLVCSTGLIGHYLPMPLLLPGIGEACHQLARGTRADADVARAILTTDTTIKSARARMTPRRLQSRTSRPAPGTAIRFGGIAKGSGMIAPDMATMLGFITTDATITAPLLRRSLRRAAAASFNRISIDSDTSTSDAVLVLASGASSARAIDAEGPRFEQFTACLTQVCCALAYQVVADGEGATHVMRVVVEGAASESDADRVGRAVVNSPLVKTAVHGADPNWGRILMAVGKSQATVVMENMSITIAGRVVFRRGAALTLRAAERRAIERAMQRPEVEIRIHLGAGTAGVQWLGCDLSKQYVTINADYTT